MSEMAPEGGAPGAPGPSRRMLWIIVGIIAVAILAYLYFRNRSGASTGVGPATSGGGGSITTGTTRIEKGAIQVRVIQNPREDEDNDQPRPPHHHRGGHHHHGHPAGPRQIPRGSKPIVGPPNRGKKRRSKEPPKQPGTGGPPTVQ